MSFDFELVRTIVKKRGRKSEKDLKIIREYKEYILKNNIEDTIINVKKQLKKRGRKPKGGKILMTQTNMIMNGPTFTKPVSIRPNIIIHLKCKDEVEVDEKSNQYSALPYDNGLINTTQLNSSVFNMSNKLNETFELKQTHSQTHNHTHSYNPETNTNLLNQENHNNTNKMKQEMSYNHIYAQSINININRNKKSACFWCSYDFDNLPIFIPKSIFNETYEVYGCFCTPECASAYLFNENIDSQLKWERYAMLNNIYSCIYNYDDNIKPAPEPYYVLDKFYGSLSIEDYRNIHRYNNKLLIVDKPLIHTMPEIFNEKNNEVSDFDNTTNTINANDKYRLYRKKQHYTETKTTGDIKNFIVTK